MIRGLLRVVAIIPLIVKKYQQDCSNCPQLAADPFNLAAVLLRDNLKLSKGRT